MIISCDKCKKKFNVDASLITDAGRMLECGTCKHRWFFKKEIFENTVNPIVEHNDNVLDQDIPINNKEINPSDLSKEETEVDVEEEHEEKNKVNNDEALNKKIEANIDENTTVNAKPKKKKKL